MCNRLIIRIICALQLVPCSLHSLQLEAMTLTVQPASPLGKFLVPLCFGGRVGVEGALFFARALLAAVEEGCVLQRLANPSIRANRGYHALP